MSTKKSNKYEHCLQRIQEVIRGLCLSNAELSRITGYSRGQTGWIVNGKASITDRFIKVFCSTLNISEHWLLTGEGPKFLFNDRNAAMELLRERIHEFSLTMPRDAFEFFFIESNKTGITHELLDDFKSGKDVLSDAQIMEIAHSVNFNNRDVLIGPYKNSDNTPHFNNTTSQNKKTIKEKPQNIETYTPPLSHQDYPHPPDQDYIKQFKDKDLARLVIQKLIKLEKINPSLLIEIYDIIRNKIESSVSNTNEPSLSARSRNLKNGTTG